MGDVIVGIDLGTTNSLVAVADGAGPRVLGGIVPSAVRYEPDGGVVVGEEARAAAPEFPRSTVMSVKRLMGRAIGDVRDDMAYFGHPVVEGPNATVRARVAVGDGARDLSPEEVSAEILRELKGRAERELGHEVHRAVVTVPAYFDDAQRQATRHAGRLAGLEVVRIVNEPTAAALAYGLGVGAGSRARVIAVYDLGGGTFDVSILRLTPPEEGDVAFFEVLATAGDTRLGGDDVDHMLVRLFCREMNERLGAGIDPDTLAGLPASTRRALVQFAQGVKHRLSEHDHAPVEIDLGNGRVYARTVTREEFEAMISAWVDRTRRACERALRDARARLGGDAIDALVMVGGSTRIPLVRERAGEVFGVEAYTAIDPDRVVALGAAVQAGILSGAASGALLLDVIPLSLGVETAGGAVAKLIMRNSTVPARATERFSTQADGQTSVKLNIVQGEREMVADCRSLGEFHLSGLPPMPAGVPKLEVEFLVDANGVLTVSAVEQRSGRRARLQVVPNHGLSPEDVDRMEAESFAHAREDMTRHRVTDLIANARLDLKWIGGALERHRAALGGEAAAGLDAKIAALRALVERAEADWRSVEPDALHAAKDAVERASVRLQEVAIVASLRQDESR